jgi:tetratricopeptide (TPR) repeat protein
VSSDIRGRLGESLASMERFAAPPEQATTSSLEALKAFSEATRRRAEGREPEAAVLYERAAQLDPNFAMAYARLAATYGNLSDFPKMAAAAERAYQLRDRVSERERFYIESHYHTALGHTALRKKTYEEWKGTYPRDTAPRNNLSIVLFDEGAFEQSVQEAAEANRLDPSLPFPYANLCGGYTALNKLAEARAVALKGIEVRPAYTELHACLYSVGFLEGDEATMQRARELSMRASGRVSARLEAAMLQGAMALGKLRQAIALADGLALRMEQEGRLGALSEGLAGFGGELAAVGALAAAKRYAVRARRVAGRDENSPWVVPTVLFVSGDPRAAAEVFDSLRKKFLTDSTFAPVWIPATEASRHLAGANYQAALDALADTSHLERRHGQLAFLRGQALLGLGRAAEAIPAFERAYVSRLVSVPSVLGPVSQVWLARAHARAGDTASARRSYQDVFATWKEGDADLPLLVQAKAEYAALK